MLRGEARKRPASAEIASRINSTRPTAYENLDGAVLIDFSNPISLVDRNYRCTLASDVSPLISTRSSAKLSLGYSFKKQFREFPQVPTPWLRSAARGLGLSLFYHSRKRSGSVYVSRSIERDTQSPSNLFRGTATAAVNRNAMICTRSWLVPPMSHS